MNIATSYVQREQLVEVPPQASGNILSHVLDLGLGMFYTFIPMLPCEWKYIYYVLFYNGSAPACCLEWGGASEGLLYQSSRVCLSLPISHAMLAPIVKGLTAPSLPLFSVLLIILVRVPAKSTDAYTGVSVLHL